MGLDCREGTVVAIWIFGSLAKRWWLKPLEQTEMTHVEYKV